MEKIREQRQKQENGLGVFLVCRQQVFEGEVDTTPVAAFYSEQRAQEAAAEFRREAEGSRPKCYYPVLWVEVIDRD